MKLLERYSRWPLGPRGSWCFDLNLITFRTIGLVGSRTYLVGRPRYLEGCLRRVKVGHARKACTGDDYSIKHHSFGEYCLLATWLLCLRWDAVGPAACESKELPSGNLPLFDKIGICVLRLRCPYLSRPCFPRYSRLFTHFPQTMPNCCYRNITIKFMCPRK